MMWDMGSSDETVAMEADSPETDSGARVVKWERFLPTMALRVLLVESDDSTRQIIAALLRKCNFRVVAVSDGLKAWEILKGRTNNIDLILTEVDLPSISGFALLTLIQEHDGCKKIPVIMMSSKYSINKVYKCMTRGATNYLLKPVRINELKNLWQHVWRRQLSTVDTNGQQDESEAPQNDEAIAENDAACNQLGKGDNELLGKGSDVQSSCTKPDADADFAGIEQKQDYNINEFLKIDEKVATIDLTINLIRAFDNSPQRIYIDSSLKSDLQPDLGLSLRQSDPSCITNQKHEEKHSLKHSDSSAFSRYMDMPLISPHSGSVNLQNQDFSRITENNNTAQSIKAGNFECYAEQQNHQQRDFPAPILVKGIRLGNCRSKLGSSPAPLIHADSFEQSSCDYYNSDCLERDPHDQKSCNLSSNQISRNHELLKLEECGAHISPPATDGSGSSSFCNGTSLSTVLNSIMDCGSGTGEDSSQRSIQREAALVKFRLKRKDRCFEKVRYENRKKLAEQRPRVKGQFVRQSQTNGDSNL